MPAEMTAAELVAEARRQSGNFATVILDRDDALRLVALVEAAVEVNDQWEDVSAEEEADLPRGFVLAMRRFDALARGEKP